MDELICPTCKSRLSLCPDLKLVIRQGKLTVDCPLCGVWGIPVDIKDGCLINREEE